MGSWFCSFKQILQGNFVATKFPSALLLSERCVAPRDHLSFNLSATPRCGRKTTRSTCFSRVHKKFTCAYAHRLCDHRLTLPLLRDECERRLINLSEGQTAELHGILSGLKSVRNIKDAKHSADSSVQQLLAFCRMTLKIAQNEVFVTLIIAISLFFEIFAFKIDNKHCTVMQTKRLFFSVLEKLEAFFSPWSSDSILLCSTEGVKL